MKAIELRADMEKKKFPRKRGTKNITINSHIRRTEEKKSNSGRHLQIKVSSNQFLIDSFK